MTATLTWRYALELTVLFPCAVYALLPVRHYLRYRPAAVYGAAAVILTLFVLGGGVVCTRQNLDTDDILLPCMAICFAAYCAAVKLNIWKKTLCFARPCLKNG